MDAVCAGNTELQIRERMEKNRAVRWEQLVYTSIYSSCFN